MRASFAAAVGMTVCLSSLATAAPGPAPQSAPVTVGSFVRQVAAAVDGETRTLDQARDTLLRLGLKLQFDPAAPLTEAFVAGLAADLGVAVQPSQAPATQITPARASAMAGLLALSANRSHGGGDPLPTECLSSVNRGNCVNCCKATGAAATDCAHFCHANVPTPPSSPEPQP
jgi:hypothetical protein